MSEPIHLVGRVVDGPAASAAGGFDSFMEEQERRLFAALCLITGDRYEAEEIAQEAFLRVFERWGRVEEMDDPAGYLFRTAMNVFRTKRRRAAVALRRAVGVAPTPDAFTIAEDRATVAQGLSKVSADQRAALVVTALYGFSSQEAARVLGTSPSNVRMRAARARDAMRSAIGEDR